MKATRIAAIAILWATAPFYSRVPYGLHVALEGKAIASYGARYVLAGYMISATIASEPGRKALPRRGEFRLCSGGAGRCVSLCWFLAYRQ